VLLLCAPRRAPLTALTARPARLPPALIAPTTRPDRLPPRPAPPPAADDSHLVLASDGLFAEEERGGGGGLDNDTVAELCAAGSKTSCEDLAATMALAAQEVGSTDDVTLVVLRLGSA
jgi:hypothetical protein